MNFLYYILLYITFNIVSNNISRLSNKRKARFWSGVHYLLRIPRIFNYKLRSVFYQSTVCSISVMCYVRKAISAPRYSSESESLGHILITFQIIKSPMTSHTYNIIIFDSPFGPGLFPMSGGPGESIRHRILYPRQ